VSPARFVITAALGVFAFAAAANGLDRMSRGSPALERLVPAPFRAASDRAAAVVALSRNRGQDAEKLARAAVARDPVDPDSAALLGSAYALRGNDSGAEPAYRVAARLGWRNVAVQLYWFEAALQRQDYRLAADRADAVLRVYPAFPQAISLLAPLEQDPRGKNVLIQHLARQPPWLSMFVNVPKGMPSEALTRRADLLTALGSSGHPVGCRPIYNFVTMVLRAGDRTRAVAAWNANCPEAQVHGPIADAGFGGVGQPEGSPLGWQVFRSGDISVDTVNDAVGGRQVVLGSRVSDTRLALRQTIDLAPGTYRVQATVLDRASRPSDRVMASVGCNYPPFPVATEGRLSGAGQVLLVPACKRVVLGLWLRPGTGEVKMDSLRVNKAS
jgi:tetratricopeptide (TPR) repeat protein